MSVPLGAAVVWLLVVKGTYASVEKIFLFACLVYVAYIVSAILVKPDWKQAAIYSVKPVLMLQGAYIYMLIGMVGTSIAPWMQFYLQAAVVEKGVTAKEYKESRIEVIVGCIAMSVIAFFIIVACAGTIYAVAPRDLQVPADAARGCVRLVTMPTCCSPPGCSMRRCSPPASCRFRRPTRCAKAWASSPA